MTFIKSITIILFILFGSSYTYSNDSWSGWEKIDINGELSNELMYSSLNSSSPYNLNNWQGIKNWSDTLKLMLELDTKNFLDGIGLKTNWYNKIDIDEFSSKGSLTRCYLDLDLKNLLNLSGLQLRVGRQRLPWGQGFIWNPVEDTIDTPRDLANITQAINEIKGNDSLKLDIPFSNYVFLSIYSLLDNTSIDRVALRLSSTFLNCDLSFIGASGSKDQRPIMGLNFSKVVFEKLNLRGSVAVQNDSKIKEEKNRIFLKYVLGADYIFGGSNFSQIKFEFYHNQEGFQDINDYINFSLQNPDRSISSARIMQNYLYTGITFDFTNEIIADLHSFLNLDDKSYIINPELKILFGSDFEFSLLGGFLAGGLDTEFGSLPKKNLIVFKIKRYF